MTIARTIKAIAEIAFSILLLPVLLPVMALIALAIRLDSRGPAIFTQTRSGKDGHDFTIYKFRTMTVNPNRSADLNLADAGITRVGHFLRNTSLDELPQLFNVLNGTMSLIGPRPTLPVQVAQYTPFQRRRLEVRPGITGWAQVNGRNSLSWERRIELDVWYVDNWSLWLDCKILFHTIRVVLHREGVYGEGGVNRGV